MMDTEKLTTKQAKAIPKILAARTHEEGCQAAGISKTTFYTWMQDETFKGEFERQRNGIVETAFGMIAQNVERAVSALVGLLDSKDDRLRRLTANDIVSHFLKHRELKEIEDRLTAIEGQLSLRPGWRR